MIRMARRSGCFFIVAGLESITPSVLKAMGRKDNKVGSYEKNLRIFRKNKSALLTLSKIMLLA
jgi:hypothetical protein